MKVYIGWCHIIRSLCYKVIKFILSQRVFSGLFNYNITNLRVTKLDKNVCSSCSRMPLFFFSSKKIHIPNINILLMQKILFNIKSTCTKFFQDVDPRTIRWAKELSSESWTEIVPKREKEKLLNNNIPDRVLLTCPQISQVYFLTLGWCALLTCARKCLFVENTPPQVSQANLISLSNISSSFLFSSCSSFFLLSYFLFVGSCVVLISVVWQFISSPSLSNMNESILSFSIYCPSSSNKISRLSGSVLS